MTLPEPTLDSVTTAVADYDRDPRNALADRTLTQLFKRHTTNKCEADVLEKVAVLNALYSTQIYDVITVARHIVALNVDDQLQSGALSVVDLIASVTFKTKNGDRVRNNHSFATKYCSWHNVAAFPIYDKYVLDQLFAYQADHRFADFTRESLKVYPQFVRALSSFQMSFSLSGVTIRDIDKFLWLEGKAATARKAASKAAKRRLAGGAQ